MLQMILWLSIAFAADPVRVQLANEPNSLDPAVCDDLFCLQLLWQTTRTLMRTDGEGKIVEGLARSYSVSKDGKSYRFKLREDAKWSDGQPVKAQEVVDGILHTLDPKTASADASLLYTIRGGKAYGSGKGKREAVAARVDKGDVVIELEHADVGFLGALTFPLAGPRRFAQWAIDQPTSGRYVVKRWKPEGEIQLEPNPHYSEPGQLPISFMYLPDETTAQNLFLAGKLDVMNRPVALDAAAYQARGVARSYPVWSLGYLVLNPGKAPLDDVDWRRAVIGAIRREDFPKILPDYQAAAGLVPRGLSDFVEVKSDLSASVAKIRGLATKPRLKLTYARSATTDLIMQKVQADVRKSLGVELDVEGTDWKTLFARSRNDPPQMYYMGMAAAYDAPMLHLRIFTRDPAAPSDHKYVYINEDYEKLVDQIERTIDARTRRGLIERALRLVQERDAVVLPLTQGTRTLVIANAIRGVRMNPASQILWHEVRRAQ